MTLDHTIPDGAISLFLGTNPSNRILIGYSTINEYQPKEDQVLATHHIFPEYSKMLKCLINHPTEASVTKKD